MNVYFFKLSEKFIKNGSYKVFSCKKRKYKSVNILTEKVKIHI